uniref:Uncharacterized protein n=1 Tax=Arundo donax TaxID=35708 RepID=A0A0A9U4C2_ARUDO
MKKKSLHNIPGSISSTYKSSACLPLR